MKPHFEGPGVTLYHGDCIEVMRSLPDESVHAVVTDPPYALSFMGRGWDTYTPLEFELWCAEWAAECFRLLKPGGHLLAFGGTRTWHRLAAGVENAGFDIRDSIAWLYGSGFPKSLDVAKAIDKAARGVPQGGADPTSINHGKYKSTKTEGKRWDGDSGQGYGAGGSRFLADGTASGLVTEPAESGAAAIAPEAETWRGWGTALKPAFEPIVVARKPLIGTVAVNVLTHGTGALNIDGARVGFSSEQDKQSAKPQGAATALNGALAGKAQQWRSDTTQTGRSTTAETTDSSATSRAVSAGSVGGTGRAEFTPKQSDLGRWPANVLLDGSQADELDKQSGEGVSRIGKPRGAGAGEGWGMTSTGAEYEDHGGASRFFPTFRYEAKAPTSERPTDGLIAHPTVKPLDLMRWLVRLVTPLNGVVLEPFAGSGTTLEAAALEGFEVIGIEREPDYLPLIINRLSKPMQQSLFGDWEESA